MRYSLNPSSKSDNDEHDELNKLANEMNAKALGRHLASVEVQMNGNAMGSIARRKRHF